MNRRIFSVLLLFSVLVLDFGSFASERSAAAFQRSPILKRLADAIAGRSLVAATAHLDEIARFEDESSADA